MSTADRPTPRPTPPVFRPAPSAPDRVASAEPLTTTDPYRAPEGAHLSALVTIEAAERIARLVIEAVDHGRLAEARALLVALVDGTTATTCTQVKDPRTSDRISGAAHAVVRRARSAAAEVEPSRPEPWLSRAAAVEALRSVADAVGEHTERPGLLRAAEILRHEDLSR